MARNEDDSPPILNPNIYLNYLRPTVAGEYEAARDVFLVTLGALLWDILSSLPSDWKLINTSQFSPVLLAYFLSRTCALVVVFMSVLTKTGPVQNCGIMGLILSIFWVLASGSSSYLLLKRVHAVFFQERLARHAFTVLWVVGFGASMTMLPGPLHDYYEIANTKHCANVRIKNYVAVAFIVPVLFDALVFFAISYKILKSHRTTKLTQWKAFCCAETLPHLSRAVLQGGQQYYMVTTGVNVTRSILVLLPNVSPILQLSHSIPAVALTSIMACRVFRNLRLEAMHDTEVGILTTIRFADKERANDHQPKSTDPAFAEADLA